MESQSLDQKSYILLKSLIGFRYSVKAEHWNSRDWQEHLALDKIYEDLDPIIDNVGEVIFMSRGLNLSQIIDSKFDYVGKLNQGISYILDLLHEISELSDNDGIINLVNGISQDFIQYKGWLRLSGYSDQLEIRNEETVLNTPSIELNSTKKIWSILKDLNCIDSFTEINSKIQASAPLDPRLILSLESKGLIFKNNILSLK